MTTLSRRKFLTKSGAAALGAGMVFVGLSAEQAMGAENPDCMPTEWTDETDIVVIGAGGAGISAALAAAEAGSRVVVLEKRGITGGSTAMCGQAIMGVNTSIQRELGIEDSVDKALAYFNTVGDAREDLMRFILEHSGEAVEWLIGLGMEVPAAIGNPGLVYGGQEVARADIAEPIMRTHYPVKPEPGLWPVLQKAADANDLITVLTDTPAVALVQDPATREIKGVITGGETPMAIKANQAVVLSAGGYARNKDMMKSLISKYDVQTTANTGDEGDGINLGVSAGAAIGYFGMLSNVQYSKPIMPCVFIVLGPDNMEGKPPFILVNVKGERWSNERKFYSYICDDLLKQPEGRGYLITCGENGLAGMAVAGEEAFKADTLEELAQQMGADPEVLVHTVDQWNACCAEGVDNQFSRTTELYPINEGPYYAAEVKPGCASTFGGLTVDTEMHVIAALGNQPIPRLYAAGMNTMAIGRFYPTCGTAVATAITTGLQAGRSASAELPQA